MILRGQLEGEAASMMVEGELGSILVASLSMEPENDEEA